MDTVPGTTRPTPLERTRLLLALERPDIIVIVIYGVALGLLSLAVPIAVQSLVNTVAFGSLLQPLVVLAVLLAVALTGAAILRALQVRIAEMLQRRLFARIVTELGARLPRVRARDLERANGPELINRFFDVFTTQKSVAALLLDGVDALLIALVGLIVLAFYHPFLLAFAIVLIAASIVVLIPLGRGGTATSVMESKAKYAMAGWLEEMARHPLSFKLAGGERFAKERVESLARTYLDRRDVHFRIVFRQLVGSLTVEVVASVALLAMGGFLVIERELSIGQLVAAELIVTAVVTSIAKLGGKVEKFYDLVAAVDKLGEMLDLPVERSDGENPPGGGAEQGRLFLDEVTFIDGRDQVAYEVSTMVMPGERIAIHGAPERVTSSFADTLFGLVPPDSGVLEIDGHDARDLSLPELRSRIAVVRGTEVLPCEISENLRPGNIELPADEAWGVLRRVGLEAHVKSLPDGLHTFVNIHGAPLTRAQAIAMTIARALAAKPSVLVLDRTLDQLDPPERARVVETLFSARDVSFLIITEDPALIARADRTLSLGDPTPQQGEAA
ncbi:MAG: ABC transporter ATP-binding protein [Myxococcota bacterium]